MLIKILSGVAFFNGKLYFLSSGLSRNTSRPEQSLLLFDKVKGDGTGGTTKLGEMDNIEHFPKDWISHSNFQRTSVPARCTLDFPYSFYHSPKKIKGAFRNLARYL